MAQSQRTTATPVTLRLSGKARAKLAQEAAQRGQDISAIASELIENAVTRPSISQIMAPVRKQAAESGMKEEEISDFLRGELREHRRQKKAKSS